MKAITKPHADVVMVLQGVCILLGQSPDTITDPASGKKVPDWWGTAKKLVGGADFLNKLLSFDKDSIPERRMKALVPLLAESRFNEAHLTKISKAVAGLATWVIAIEACHRISAIVKAKQAQL